MLGTRGPSGDLPRPSKKSSGEKLVGGAGGSEKLGGSGRRGSGEKLSASNRRVGTSDKLNSAGKRPVVKDGATSTNGPLAGSGRRRRHSVNLDSNAAGGVGRQANLSNSARTKLPERPSHVPASAASADQLLERAPSDPLLMSAEADIAVVSPRRKSSSSSGRRRRQSIVIPDADSDEQQEHGATRPRGDQEEPVESPRSPGSPAPLARGASLSPRRRTSFNASMGDKRGGGGERRPSGGDRAGDEPFSLATLQNDARAELLGAALIKPPEKPSGSSKSPSPPAVEHDRGDGAADNERLRAPPPDDAASAAGRRRSPSASLRGVGMPLRSMHPVNTMKAKKEHVRNRVLTESMDDAGCDLCGDQSPQVRAKLSGKLLFLCKKCVARAIRGAVSAFGTDDAGDLANSTRRALLDLIRQAAPSGGGQGALAALSEDSQSGSSPQSTARQRIRDSEKKRELIAAMGGLDSPAVTSADERSLRASDSESVSIQIQPNSDSESVSIHVGGSDGAATESESMSSVIIDLGSSNVPSRRTDDWSSSSGAHGAQPDSPSGEMPRKRRTGSKSTVSTSMTSSSSSSKGRRAQVRNKRGLAS